MSHYVQNRTYTGFDVPKAESEEPTLIWVSPGPPNEEEVDIEIAAGDFLLLVGKSTSGTFYCLAQVSGNPITERGKGANFSDVDTIVECVGGW
jgi:hypothetical protein